MPEKGLELSSPPYIHNLRIPGSQGTHTAHKTHTLHTLGTHTRDRGEVMHGKTRCRGRGDICVKLEKRGSMKVNLPDSLKGFVDAQVNSGRYADPDAFVAELIETEAAIFERLKRGNALPLDEHFDRRLEVPRTATVQRERENHQRWGQVRGRAGTWASG